MNYILTKIDDLKVGDIFTYYTAILYRVYKIDKDYIKARDINNLCRGLCVPRDTKDGINDYVMKQNTLRQGVDGKLSLIKNPDMCPGYSTREVGYDDQSGDDL